MAQIFITDANSSLVGSAGDDQYVTQLSGFNFITVKNFEAGTGIDSLDLNAATTPLPTASGALTNYGFADMSSLERIEYHALAGQWIAFNTALGSVAEGTLLVGSAGRDGAAFFVTTPGDYTIPLLQFSNWGPSAGTGVFQDYVTLSARDNGDHVLRARDDYGALQVLQGGSGNDMLFGGNTQDALQLSTGFDEVFGGGGDDFFLLVPSASAINGVLDGGEGVDTLLVQASTIFGDVTIESIESVVFAPIAVGPGAPPPSPPRLEVTTDTVVPDVEVSGTGQFFVHLTDNGTADLSNVIFDAEADIEISIEGSETADSITGSSRGDVLNGKGGDDSVYGGMGADTLYGGIDGNDSLFGGDGEDYIVDDEGDDLLAGGAGDDQLIGGIGKDDLSGGEDDDTLFGGADDDVVAGGSGNDVLFGDAGNDKLYGGEGEDRLLGDAGDDLLNGGAGTDFFGYVGFGAFDQGHDRIEGFSAEDFLFTSERIRDNNGDGIISFGRNRLLDLDDTTNVSIAGTGGKAVKALEYDGEFQFQNITFYVYSLVGSTLDFHDFLDAPADLAG